MPEPASFLARAWATAKRWAVAPIARERRRIALVFALCLAVFAYVGNKLVRVQIRPDVARVRTVGNVVRELHASRGPILDRNGEPLAVSVDRWKLAIDAVALPDPAKHPDKVRCAYTNLLALGVCDDARLRETFGLALVSKKPRNKKLCETENADAVRAIARSPLLASCVAVDDVSRRENFGGRDFAHLLGAVNSHGEPQYGVERRFHAELSGTNGRIVAPKARGRELRGKRVERVAPVDGSALWLTIDRDLQHAVCEILDDAMDQYDPDAAWAIVEDVATGEILAMASRPDFDPDDYYRLAQQDSPRLWNSAVFQSFEPGSVMKTLVTAAALQEGLVATNTVLDVSDTLYCGRRLQDHKGMADRITVTELIKFSSNRGASRLAMLLGKARTEKWLRAFGLGEKTGVQLPGENAGIVRPHRSWSDLQGIRVAIGQGVSVTGIQLVNAYACLANGGRLLRPTIARRIVAADGRTVWEHEPEEIRRPVSEKVAREMAFMLSQVVAPGGTARRAAVPGYGVAGKTGTAQLVVGRAYSTTDYCASFCGFFPVRDPQLAILVTVKRPRRTERNPLRLHTGGAVAAPVFARIAAAAAERYLIPTDAEAAAPPPEPLSGEPEEDEPDIPFEDLPPDEID
ncbi:MAG: penicillin-binding protein 2 [Kiritimatiellae bacterium]|nr:penicillin-binding protein 2 [Kiritimatiellia bacterium]